jgi:putative FmdB family regulatory protein
MPTYEYACPKCGMFDLFQSMKDAPLTKCPTCRSKVKRQIGTGAGVIFKGSGFYQTDYRSDNYRKSAKSDTAPAAPAATDSAAATPAAATPVAASAKTALAAPAVSRPEKKEKTGTGRNSES